MQASLDQQERRQARSSWRVRSAALLFVALAWMALVVLPGRFSTAHRAPDQAPSVELRTLSGETIRLDDLRGKGVVVNFWASWCGPCRAETPLLQETWRREQERGEILFLGVAYLDRQQPARAFLDEYGVTYPNVLDEDGGIARRFGVRAIPQSYFIAPDGRIVEVAAGALLAPSALDARLDRIRPSSNRAP